MTMETTKSPLTASKVAMYMRVGSLEQVGAVVGYVRCAAQDRDGQELKKQAAKVMAVAATHGLA